MSLVVRIHRNKSNLWTTRMRRISWGWRDRPQKLPGLLNPKWHVRCRWSRGVNYKNRSRRHHMINPSNQCIRYRYRRYRTKLKPKIILVRGVRSIRINRHSMYLNIIEWRVLVICHYNLHKTNRSKFRSGTRMITKYSLSDDTATNATRIKWFDRSIAKNVEDAWHVMIIIVHGYVIWLYI